MTQLKIDKIALQIKDTKNQNNWSYKMSKLRFENE